MTVRRRATMLATLISAVAFAVTVLAAPTSASHAGTYCFNGVTTTLHPAPTISASSVTGGSRSVSLTLGIATTIIDDGWTVFYFGYDGATWKYAPSPSSLESGYTSHTLTAGACESSPGAAPAVTHVGVCKLLPRGDGTTGLFQQITVADWNDSKGKYFDAPAANWVEGLGLTCDNAIGLGYKAAGYNVAWGGKPDPAHDPGGVRASGFNNIYPYFVK